MVRLPQGLSIRTDPPKLVAEATELYTTMASLFKRAENDTKNGKPKQFAKNASDATYICEDGKKHEKIQAIDCFNALARILYGADDSLEGGLTRLLYGCPQTGGKILIGSAQGSSSNLTITVQPGSGKQECEPHLYGARHSQKNGTLQGDNRQDKNATLPGDNRQGKNGTLPGDNRQDKNGTLPGDSRQEKNGTLLGDNRQEKSVTPPADPRQQKSGTLPVDNRKQNSGTPPVEEKSGTQQGDSSGILHHLEINGDFTAAGLKTPPEQPMPNQPKSGPEKSEKKPSST
ncbi:hypothetical protein O181_023351 [Austropuccinia psidii MF-1]|uniref:Uncharacterized protein n=1 Tax=Austropuccinia psidii MF-1 TaxID=1389203 RepID=A0A9Q3CJ78_9BASI|nr:hypothetical protein [Austropuccinia psidii MF-1]